MTRVRPALLRQPPAAARHYPMRQIWSLAFLVVTLTNELAAQTPADSAVKRIAADSTRIVATLSRLRNNARAGSPAVVVARAELDVAVARAAASGLPSPAFISAGVSEAPARNLDQGNFRLEVGRDFLTGPRRQAERSYAAISVRVAELEMALAERRVDAAIVESAIHAAALRGIGARLNAEDLLLAGAEEGVRGRFSIGEARYIDVLRVRTERLRVQSERSSSLGEGRAIEAEVRALAGSSETRASLAALIDTLSTSALGEAWRAILPPALSVDSLLALTGTVQRRSLEMARALANGELARAERGATLNGYAGVQRIGQANNGPTLGPSIGITLSLPFTAAKGNRLSAVAATQAVAAATRVRDVERGAARAELEGLVELYAAARSRVETFDAALLRGAREERESALLAYGAGEMSLVELIDFERALARAEIERLRALIDAVDAWARLVSGDDSRGVPKSSFNALEGR